jgi:hypothetical protein
MLLNTGRTYFCRVRRVTVSVKKMISRPADRTRGFTLIELQKPTAHDGGEPDDKQAATD